MDKSIKKIALLTGDGDCPGLNAAIRAITKTAILNYGYEVIGYTRGFLGLLNNDYIELNLNTVSGILRNGGSIIYTSNKDDLFHFVMEENGKKVTKDVSDEAVKNLKKDGVDALIILGGDDALKNAYKYYKKGINVIGVPKTINNDILETDVSFGFNSALRVAVEALDRLHTTAASHHRVMILEVMGKSSGWLALEAGIAGSADVILIPEIPYDINKVVDKITERKKSDKFFTIIVVAEGAQPKDKENIKHSNESIGHRLTNELEEILEDQEVRCAILGHTQRGGDASTYDRLLATRMGVKAVDSIAEGSFGKVISLKGRELLPIPLENIVDGNKLVNPDDELVRTARSIGIVLGD